MQRVYVAVRPTVDPGRRFRVAVLEVPRRPHWWQVWVDGRPVSEPVKLPGSHGRWQPMAMSESWNRGVPSCNGFAYRFSGVQVARRPGTGWQRLRNAYRLADRGYRVAARTPTGFVARST